MSEIVLVTGATGNIGSKLVSQLAGMGIKVRAAVRKPAEASALQRDSVELVEFDYSKPETVTRSFAGVTKAFLLTPFAPNMVDLAKQLAEGARYAGVKQLVRLSAMGAGSADTIPSKWHWEAEKAVERTGIPFTHLRPNFFMQNIVNFQGATIRSQNAFYQPAGHAKVSFIDTRDIAAAAAIILTKPGHTGRVYTLTGSESITNTQAAESLSKMTGRKIAYVDVSEEATRAAISSNGMPETLIEAMMNLYASMKSGHMAEISPALEQLLGRKPITFAQFAADYADQLKQA